MLSFIKFDEESGIWANRDEAIEYLEQGYKAYTDSDCLEELSEEELEETDDRDTTGIDSFAETRVSVG